MTTPDQPKFPPRKPVELPPIDRTPVDDTSNAAYSALTPRPRVDDASEQPDTGTPRVSSEPSPAAVDPAVAHVQATATAAAARSKPTPEPTGLGLSRAALVVSVLLSMAASVAAVVLSASATPSPIWPLYLGASVGAVAALLAALARRHRGWKAALALAAVVVVGCIGFAFVVA